MSENQSHIVLKTKKLSVGYTSKKETHLVASDIDIELNKGELVALVGANGIGKSTLLRTLTNVQKPLSGTTELNGVNLYDYAPLDLAKELSLVLTEHQYSKNLTVYDLIALGRQPYTNWIGTLSETDTILINNVLTQVSINELRDKNCFQLSDGQLQKVLIARALAQDTALIVLDEPTTHLDMYHKAYVLNLLKKLASETQKTILFSSHEIDLAIQLCDKIVLMLDDEVVSGTPKELIEKGRFNELFPKDLIVFDEESASFKVKK